MPELPEVETLKLGLEKYLVGHKIEDVEVRKTKIFQGDPQKVIGATVLKIERVGKGLIIVLDNGFSLVIHLKLTGQMVYRDKNLQNLVLSIKAGGILPNKHTHVIFTLDKGANLFYTDTRQFGYIKVIKSDELKTLTLFKDMGPEPFKDLTLEIFEKTLAKSALAIKILLMDQKRIGGIGNIYANDALFLAKIDPRRPAKSIKAKEVESLFNAVLEVLSNGLKYGGASDVDFVNALGQDGHYQDYFLAYGKKGENCSICDGIIEKIQLGGRGTFYCPKHQK
jgi:formamidopyrimidine-DNA glycosylase